MQLLKMVALAAMCLLLSCKKYDTFEEYCQQVNGSDGFSIVTTFDDDAIRDDLVRHYHSIFVENIARTHYLGISVQDPDFVQLIKKRNIGVTHKEKVMYINYPLLKSNSEIERDTLDDRIEYSIEDFHQGFLEFLMDAHNLSLDNDHQRCLFIGFGSLFNQVVISNESTELVIDTKGL